MSFVNGNDVGNPHLTPLPVTSDLIGFINAEVDSLEQKQKSIPQPTEQNWKEVLSLLKIDPLKQYSKPIDCISINNQNGKCRFGTLGNFSLLIGKAKSRKTFFLSYVISQVLNNSEDGKFTICLPENQQRIVLFDTEQTEDDVSQVMDRAIRTAGKWKKTVESYSLRIFPPAQRKFLIEKYLYNTVDVGLVFIDGIRDLITDINSPQEATSIASDLLRWTGERNIHIVTVLHQNKGDNNARGHVGTELVNKAETVVSVEKNDEISVIKPEQCRGKDFEPFAFGVNQDGLPFIVDDWAASGSPKTEKINLIQNSKEWHWNTVKSLFGSQTQLQYGEMLEAIKNTFLNKGIKGGTNEQKKLISFYINNGYVSKEKLEGIKYPVYQVIQSV